MILQKEQFRDNRAIQYSSWQNSVELAELSTVNKIGFLVKFPPILINKKLPSRMRELSNSGNRRVCFVTKAFRKETRPNGTLAALAIAKPAPSNNTIFQANFCDTVGQSSSVLDRPSSESSKREKSKNLKLMFYHWH